jgi:hypothetical protein
MTNPMSWATYLSVGVEIAALSALAGITAKMNKWVYLPFLIVTLIQFIGNVFFSFQYIDITNKVFLAWVDLVNPLFDSIGMATSGDLLAHKRWLALFAGGLIPVISLSFLHLLISFNDRDEEPKKETTDPIPYPANDITKPLVDPVTGIVNMEYNPEKIEKDFYLPSNIEQLMEDARILGHTDKSNEVKRTFVIPVGSNSYNIKPEITEVEYKQMEPIKEDITIVNEPEAETNLEAITETIVSEDIETPPEVINHRTSDKNASIMSIGRIGRNKIIKNLNPNEIYYKRGDV